MELELFLPGSPGGSKKNNNNNNTACCWVVVFLPGDRRQSRCLKKQEQDASIWTTQQLYLRRQHELLGVTMRRRRLCRVVLRLCPLRYYGPVRFSSAVLRIFKRVQSLYSLYAQLYTHHPEYPVTKYIRIYSSSKGHSDQAVSLWVILTCAVAGDGGTRTQNARTIPGVRLSSYEYRSRNAGTAVNHKL